MALKSKGKGAERLLDVGLEVRSENNKIFVDNIGFDSPAQKVGLEFDWQIIKLLADVERPAKQWMFIPALFLLALIASVQLKRRKNSI